MILAGLSGLEGFVWVEPVITRPLGEEKKWPPWNGHHGIAIGSRHGERSEAICSFSSLKPFKVRFLSKMILCISPNAILIYIINMHR